MNAIVQGAKTAVEQMERLVHVGKASLLKVSDDVLRVVGGALEISLSSTQHSNRSPTNGSRAEPAGGMHMNAGFDDLFNTLLQVGKLQTEKAVPGEKPVSLSAGPVSAEIQTIAGSKLFDASWKTVEAKASLEPNVNGTVQPTDKVNVQIWSFKSDPLTTNNGAAPNSAVASLKVSVTKKDLNITSATITVANNGDAAGQEIEFFLKHNETFCVKKLTVHKPGTAVIMEVLSSGSLVEGLEILVWQGKLPGLDPITYDHHFMIQLNAVATDEDLSSRNKASDVQDHRPNHFFIPSSDTNAGEYYIGLRHNGSSGSVKLNVWTAACKIWDSDHNQWSYALARVHPSTTVHRTVCEFKPDSRVNFGKEKVFVGAEFLTPNAIDFSTVFSKFDLVSNGAVFSTVIMIVLLYLLVLLWARKADEKDNEKNTILCLFDEKDKYSCKLLLRIATSNKASGRTTSPVSFILHYEKFDSGICELSHPLLKEFKRKQVYNFIFSMPHCSGKPTCMKIWLGCDGHTVPWNVREVSVLDLQKRNVYTFRDKTSTKTDITIGLNGKTLEVADDSTHFSNQKLASHAVKTNFTEGHLWYSVVLRPFKTNFSRVHRISCCVTLLFLMMIANAMWFGKKQAASETGGGVVVGSLSLTDILISLFSSLVEVPVSLVVVLIFRNSRSEGERPPGQKSSWRGPWPGGCRFLGWGLIVLAVLSSGFFTILYSMEWGPEKANRWLVRFLTTFLMSVVLIQPVKIIVFAIIKFIMWKWKKDTLKEEMLRPFSEHIEIIYNSGLKEPNTGQKQSTRLAISLRDINEEQVMGDVGPAPGDTAGLLSARDIHHSLGDQPQRSRGDLEAVSSCA
uniref:Polycystic kidney disease protein 1-like 2 n=1 Tax=Petromyzon marinus TaxID=7757 RepID=A0AAJ7T8Y0_PETMA|nr:polycystic kidney disease protein 1-like 2 [Petromyzon marinus]